MKPESGPPNPELKPSLILKPEIEPEAPGIKITPRRGRPRSKKTSEVVTEVKQEVKEEEDRSRSRQSSPGLPRPTSPSPEVGYLNNN